MKKNVLCVFLNFSSICSLGQKSEDSVLSKYLLVFDTVSVILNKNASFKESVFWVESLVQDNNHSFDNLTQVVDMWLMFIKEYYDDKKTNTYLFPDSTNFLLNEAIFASLFDTSYIAQQRSDIKLMPFHYKLSTPLNYQTRTYSFVTTLLITHEGNCRSLSYLYKIFADELGAKCWLSLAPNHIYIRNYSEKIGWYNTELTSGTFPTDAWIAASGYVSTDAIRSGIYMDTLSNQQSIALCVLDLAKGYEFQTHNYYDGFILKCCDLVLLYHTVNPMALLLKAETLQKIYEKQTRENNLAAQDTYKQMEDTYIQLVKLGFREMPEKMYQQWLKTITTEKDRYTNKKVTAPSKK